MGQNRERHTESGKRLQMQMGFGAELVHDTKSNDQSSKFAGVLKQYNKTNRFVFS